MQHKYGRWVGRQWRELNLIDCSRTAIETVQIQRETVRFTIVRAVGRGVGCTGTVTGTVFYTVELRF
jgi:hypothetical protein